MEQHRAWPESLAIRRRYGRIRPSAGQAASIRAHLREEAGAFARDDYADPAVIHGQAMPGLAELQSGAARVRVLYEELPDGARLRFTTQDLALTAALHRWFAAQVHDHGADAVMRRQRGADGATGTSIEEPGQRSRQGDGRGITPRA